MKKQNVWAILQRLVARNFISGTSGKPKSVLTWMLNKDYDAWLPNGTSVLPEHDSSVLPEHDSWETSVMPEHDKSVIPPHERTKERKESSSSAAATTKHIVSDYVQAYQSVWGMMVASPYISSEIQDWEARVTLDGWRYALKECADRRNAGNWKYLRRILERIERDGYQPQPLCAPTTTTVNFSVEELV
jgi:hypothetical protein